MNEGQYAFESDRTFAFDRVMKALEGAMSAYEKFNYPVNYRKLEKEAFDSKDIGEWDKGGVLKANGSLCGYALWNYTPEADSGDGLGDGWNKEHLSIFSQ